MHSFVCLKKYSQFLVRSDISDAFKFDLKISSHGNVLVTKAFGQNNISRLDYISAVLVGIIF